MGHTLVKQNRPVAGTKDDILDDASGVAVHGRHDSIRAGVRRTGNAQIVPVQWFVNNAGVRAVGKGIHQSC
jgi:hypothetical protein